MLLDKSLELRYHPAFGSIDSLVLMGECPRIILDV